MIHEDTSGRPTFPTMAFCRLDFLPALAAAGNKSPDALYPQGYICYKNLREKASLDDVMQNIAINVACNRNLNLIQALEGHSNDSSAVISYFFPTYDGQDEFRSLEVAIDADPSHLAAANSYLQGNGAQQIDFNLVDEPYKLFVKGDKIFVGVERGFVTRMGDDAFCKRFLIDSLEMCRASMQNPALYDSQLYKRFVTLSLNQ